MWILATAPRRCPEIRSWQNGCAPMWFFLAQILPLLVYPLGLACLLLTVSLFCQRRPRLRRAAASLALLTLLVAGNRWVAMGLVRYLESFHPLREDLAPADVIVVLGGAISLEREPAPDGEVVRGLAYAQALYVAGLAPRILVSGGGLPWRETRVSEAEKMAHLLRERGVPREAIWIEAESRNTHENAVKSKLLLDAHGKRRIILVTSALHMRRAAACFAKEGLEVEAAPSDFIVTERKWRRLVSSKWPDQVLAVLPSAENLALTTRGVKECVGLAVYRGRSWL